MEGLNIIEEVMARESIVEELYLRSATNRKALDDSRQNLRPEFRVLQEQARKSLSSLRPDWELQRAEESRLNPAQRQHILDLGQQSEVV